MNEPLRKPRPKRSRRGRLRIQPQAVDWEPPLAGPVTRAQQAAADRLGTVIELGVEAKRLGQRFEIPDDIPRSRHKLVWARIFAALRGNTPKRSRAHEQAAIEHFVHHQEPWTRNAARGRERQHGPVHHYRRTPAR